jgi:putative transposase
VARGYDAGKGIKGSKRHIMVDTAGRPLVLRSHSAGIQDRDGAVPTLQASRKRFPFIEKVFADGGYAGERVEQATCITPEVIRKPKGQIGFAVQPRRWVVEVVITCLVAEHCWDPVGLAILDYQRRFERLPRAVRGRR